MSKRFRHCVKKQGGAKGVSTDCASLPLYMKDKAVIEVIPVPDPHQNCTAIMTHTKNGAEMSKYQNDAVYLE